MSGTVTIKVNVQGIENLERFCEAYQLLLEEIEDNPWLSSLNDVRDLLEEYYKNLTVGK